MFCSDLSGDGGRVIWGKGGWDARFPIESWVVFPPGKKAQLLKQGGCVGNIKVQYIMIKKIRSLLKIKMI